MKYDSSTVMSIRSPKLALFAQFATVAYIAAGLMLLLAIAGLIHALVTPRSKGFAVPESTDQTKREKVTA